ncbi:MAG TPA: hypothetical protein VIR54_03505 [Vicinamibacterales bacterium]
MVSPDVSLATNREAWNHVAPRFHGGTALPEYGPLAPTENTLHLLDGISGIRAWNWGVAAVTRLSILRHTGRELWGFDLSPVQIAQAGLNIEALETPVDPATTKEEPIDPARCIQCLARG